jgi:exodeoxyribonuclease V alpha subunit
MTEKIQGQVERITYSNEDNGYSVIKVRMRGRRDLVTVVGNFVAVTPGEELRMEGSWGQHSQYGEQFKVERYETLTPATVEGIRKYLGIGSDQGDRAGHGQAHCEPLRRAHPGSYRSAGRAAP